MTDAAHELKRPEDGSLTTRVASCIGSGPSASAARRSGEQEKPLDVKRCAHATERRPDEGRPDRWSGDRTSARRGVSAVECVNQFR